MEQIKPRLSVLIESPYGVSSDQLIRDAKTKGVRLVSNDETDRFLGDIMGWSFTSLRMGFPAWTGTLVAYAAPGKELGRFIQYSDIYTGYRQWFIEVPERHRHKRDVALVMEPGDYEFKDIPGGSCKRFLVCPRRFEILPAFPQKNGLYLVDPDHGIPQGKEMDSDLDPRVRRLTRVQGTYIGLVSRSCYDYDFGAGDRDQVNISLPGLMHLGAIERMVGIVVSDLSGRLPRFGAANEIYCRLRQPPISDNQ